MHLHTAPLITLVKWLVQLVKKLTGLAKGDPALRFSSLYNHKKSAKINTIKSGFFLISS